MNKKEFEIDDGILLKYKSDKQHVVVPKNVIKIGNESFKRCSSLESVEIPEGVEEIGGVFYGCYSLKNITIRTTWEI